MDEGSLVRTVYSFHTDVAGELSLDVGDVIQVKHRIDKQWLYGQCDNYEGAFPSGSVIEINLPSIKEGQQLFAAIADFPAQETGDLSFKKGDIIIGLNAVDANWWKGECNGNVGIFPLTHVWKPDQSKLKCKKDGKRVNLVGRVKMDLTAQLPGEIDLKKNDIVHITEIVDKSWYRGECNGHFGMFPSAFVTLLNESEAKQTPVISRPDTLIASENANNKNLENESRLRENGVSSVQTEIYDTFDSLGYDSLNSGITPYGRTLYPFTAQHPDQVSFKKGELVTLIRHVDDDWIEGELNGKIGQLPKNFIKIIVDCPENNRTSGNNSDQSQSFFTEKDVYVFPSDTYGRVLYDFVAEMEGDLTLKAGDTVTLIRQLNKDWYEAITDDGNVGICPANFLEVIGSTPTGTPTGFQTPVSSSSAGMDNIATPHNGFSNNNQMVSDTAWKIENKSLDSSIASNLASLDLTLKKEDTGIPRPASSLSAYSPDSEGFDAWLALRQTPPSTMDKNEKLRWSLPCGSTTQLNAKDAEEKRSTFYRTRSLSTPRRPAPPVPLSRQSSTTTPFSRNANLSASNLSLHDESAEREQEAARKKEEEKKRREEERRRKMKEQRECVIMELLQTERDYLHDLRVCQSVFLKTPSNEIKAFAGEVTPLFGNLDEVIEVSSRLLRRLESATDNMGSGKIGECFITMAEEMKEAYGHYCRNHDDTHLVLAKLETQPEIKKHIEKGVEKMKETTNCFDLPSVLIKPVQRILKYPLLLNELIKCTEETHPDHSNLLKAVNVMTDVANDINEFKRRKDLVFKYRKEAEADSSFSTRISKLNMHSVLKKYARFGVKVSSTFGLASVNKDEEFDKLAKKFHSLEKAIKIFLKNLASFMEHMQECCMNALHMSEDIGLYFQEKSRQPEVDQLRTTHRLIATQYFEDFKVSVERNVIAVLNQLLQTYVCPMKLVQKRYDKLLDYSACKTRAERNKDPNKQRALENEQQLAKSNYEALNGQLMDELPKLCALSVEVFQDCLLAFLRARKIFIGRCAKQMLTLMELPLLLGSSRDVFETFQVKHNLIVDELTKLTLVPKSLFPASSSAESSSAKHPAPSCPSASPVGTLGRKKSQSPQSTSQKAYLQNQYSAQNLYYATEKFGAVDVLDITVEKGDVVGVIKKQDPMGQAHRWFVDNGASKGFVPAKFLAKYAAPESPASSSASPQLRKHSQDSMSTMNRDSLPSYEDVMQEKQQQQQQHQPRMNRPAPVPSPLPRRNSQGGMAAASQSTAASSHRYYEPIDTIEYSQPPNVRRGSSITELMNFEDNNEPSSRNQADRYANIDEFDPYSPASRLYDNVPSNTEQSAADVYGHRYETIPEDDARELASLSPQGQARSPSVSNTTATADDNPEYFYALYEYQAQGPNQLSLSPGQVVLVRNKHDLNGNKDWWYVEDRHGNLGYVPGSYLTRYTR